MHVRLLTAALAATALVTATLGAAVPAAAQGVKIGILNDQSGVYADYGGKWSLEAAKMAVEDFAKTSPDVQVEIVSADHQNKPDVGAAVARQWYDRDGVDAILDVPTSSVALAVSQVTREKNKIFIDSGAGTTELTGKQCSPNTIQWTYDTYALAHGTAGAMLKRGGDTWYFLTADYAFGHDLEAQTTAVVKQMGGKGLGAVRAPLNTPDFSSFLLQASSSKAQIIGLAYDAMEPGIYMDWVVDRSYIMPYPSGDGAAYFDRLAFIREQHGLDLLIPNLDAELPLYIKRAADLKAAGIATFLPTMEFFTIVPAGYLLGRAVLGWFSARQSSHVDLHDA